MGKHARRFLYLPPGAKPRHRFVIALGAIVLLAFGMMAAVAAIYPENGPLAAAEPDLEDQIPDPFGGVPAGPNDGAVADPSASGPAGPLTGAYAVLSGAVSGTGFQAQILMTNTTPTPQAWRVRLRYAQSVTGVAGVWVDGQPPPTMQAVDQEFTFTGALPIPPGQTVVFKVQFYKAQQTDVTLRECTVNGRACETG